MYENSGCGSLSMLMAQVMGGKRQALGELEMGATSALKILIANKSAGSIIGKAGSTINAIKETSGARVKVSSRCFSIPALSPCPLPRRPHAAHSQKGACVAAAPSDVGMGRGVRLAGSWFITLEVCWARSGCVVDACVCKREASTVMHTDSLGTAVPKSSLAPTIVSSSYKVAFMFACAGCCNAARQMFLSLQGMLSGAGGLLLFHDAPAALHSCAPGTCMHAGKQMVDYGMDESL